MIESIITLFSWIVVPLVIVVTIWEKITKGSDRHRSELKWDDKKDLYEIVYDNYPELKVLAPYDIFYVKKADGEYIWIFKLLTYDKIIKLDPDINSHITKKEHPKFENQATPIDSNTPKPKDREEQKRATP